MLMHDQRQQRSRQPLLQSQRIQVQRAAQEVEEDAWVNDVGPSIHTLLSSEQDIQDEQTIPLAAASFDGASACRQEYVRPGHPLWPLVQRLSERIWREMHLQQEAEQEAEEESLVVERVRKRALALLHVEPRRAGLVRGRGEVTLLVQSVVDEVVGYGPLEVLLKDEHITEILAVGPDLMYVELDGQMQEVPARFASVRHMVRIIENMLRRVDLRLQAGQPLLDFRLPDGSYVNVVLSAGATNGPTILIRKCPYRQLSMADLVENGSLSQTMADFLLACVRARRNVVMCGNVGSGRTTLLNALATHIPVTERIVTIEEMAELRLGQRHVVSLVTSPGTVHTFATGASRHEHVSMRELVLAALHMRPDRLVVGECRGDEVVELFSAMNAGYDGMLTTLYARNLRDTITRLETLYRLEDHTIPIALIRSQLASTLNIIVYLARLRDGSRKIIEIAEVQGLEGDAVKLRSLFRYNART